MSICCAMLDFMFIITCVNLLDLSLLSHKFGIILIRLHAIFPTVQKLYYCAMAGPSDVMKPERFGGENFKRWQTRMKFWLMSQNLWWVISSTVERPLTQEQQRDWEVSSDTTMGCLLSLMTDQLCDIYMNYASPALVWEALDRKYGESDAGRELYVNELYHDFKMTDNNSVVTQAHEIQLLVGELAGFGVVLPDKFVVGALLPSYLHHGGALPLHSNTGGR